MSPLAISLRFLQTQPDGRLVELARAGHERAFEALVRRYRGPLLAYCRRVAPRGTAAEDILQQGLLQAWKALSGGAEVRDARAWLYRIVHNVAITTLRAGSEPAAGIASGPGAPSVDQLVEQRMAAHDALAGIAALPDLQRQVMVSTALDGQSHEEIAAALGLSSGSVRGLIYRARSTLRAAAAAVVPAPVVEWALGDAGGSSAGLAGAGSAGLGALVLKGGAILAVGAVAGTTAIVIAHRSHRARPASAIPTAASVRNAPDVASASVRGPLGAGFAAGAILPAAGRGTGSALGKTGGLDGGRVTGGGRHDGHGDGSQQGGGQGGTGRGDGTGGSQGGSDGSSGGFGGFGGVGGTSGGFGGSSGGSSGGSDGGGDHGATVATSDGGGSSGGGSDGGSSGGGSDGGSSGSSGGGGSDGGTATTTTPTSTTGTNTTNSTSTTSTTSTTSGD